MRVIRHNVAGTNTRINFPEARADLYGFEEFLARGDKILCVDTETTGLDVFKRDHRLRLVQFGNAFESWVLQWERFRDAIIRALRAPRRFTMHNAAYDLLVLDRHAGVTIEELGPRTFDTRIFAHLLDPRSDREGGIGTALKPLSTVYVDPEAADTQADLTAVFRSLGLTKATGWAGIPIDHETYVRYAGLDTIYGSRLFAELAPLVHAAGLDHLSKFEHHLQILLAMMQRKGMKIDVEYVERLREDLLREAEEGRAVARRYGVENVNSTKQVAEALVAMGEIDPDDPTTERTASGAIKVDKGVLLPLADLDPQWERIEARSPNPLANALLHAKRAEKWVASYADAFLDLRDDDDRIHPSIGGLMARTARMSVSRPPLQQLPSSDWKVRRGVVADRGRLLVGSDYKQVEMRVLAALSGDPAMLEAIASGMDIHDAVATKMFGPGFNKGQRKLAKNTGFGEVFGGGAVTLARQAGVPIEVAKEAKAIFATQFPGIKRYGRRLISRAEYGRKEVVTPSGRRLPLDRDRLYAAVNYTVQSTARDLVAQAIVDAHDAGLGDGLLLPIHDELLAQAPADSAEEYVRELGRVMESTFYGVRIEADPEVIGPSWGSGYGCPAELDAA